MSEELVQSRSFSEENSSFEDKDRGPYDRSNRSRPGAKGAFFRKKVCKFCVNKTEADYKNPDTMRRYVTDRGKILPRRITGVCARHQRTLASHIKRARTLALLPFIVQ